MRFAHGKTFGSGGLKISGGEFSMPARNLTITGVETELKLEDLLGARSLPHQTLNYSSFPSAISVFQTEN